MDMDVLWTPLNWYQGVYLWRHCPWAPNLDSFIHLEHSHEDVKQLSYGTVTNQKPSLKLKLKNYLSLQPNCTSTLLPAQRAAWLPKHHRFQTSHLLRRKTDLTSKYFTDITFFLLIRKTNRLKEKELTHQLFKQFKNSFTYVKFFTQFTENYFLAQFSTTHQENR